MSASHKEPTLDGTLNMRALSKKVNGIVLAVEAHRKGDCKCGDPKCVGGVDIKSGLHAAIPFGDPNNTQLIHAMLTGVHQTVITLERGLISRMIHGGLSAIQAQTIVMAARSEAELSVLQNRVGIEEHAHDKQEGGGTASTDGTPSNPASNQGVQKNHGGGGDARPHHKSRLSNN